MKMYVNIKAQSILIVAGITVAWLPISHPAETTGPAQTAMSVPGNILPYHPGNGGGPSIPQQIPQWPPSRPVLPEQGGGRPFSNQFQGTQGQTTSGMVLSPGQQLRIPNPSAPISHQRPGTTANSFPFQLNTGGTSPFPPQMQQLPQMPPTRPMTPQQNGVTPSSNQQQGIQGQTTSGMVSSHGQQLWIANLSAPSLHQRPGVTGSSLLSQSITGGAPLFPQQISQIPQLSGSRPMTPQQSGGTLSSNHQQGTLGQISSGTMLSPAHQPPSPNPTRSTTSHELPQQSWNVIFSPVNTQTQGPGSGLQFAQQSGQQPWNGLGTSQQSSPNQSNNGIAPSFSPHQRGTGNLSVPDQRPGEQSWRGHVGSQIPQQNAQPQWSNGGLSPSTPRLPLQQAGGISRSPQTPQGNPAGSSYIPQPGQQQQWGSGNVPQIHQHARPQTTPSNSQQGQQLSWRSGAAAGGPQQSTAVQQTNGAGQVTPNRSTQPRWSAQAATVSSQGLQHRQSFSGRGATSPGGQQNVTAQLTNGAGSPTQKRPAQPSLNGQPPSQLWKKSVTLILSQPNTQQHKALLSQLLSSFPTTNPSAVSKLSIHRRVVSIEQRTERRTLRHRTVSTSSRR